MPDGRARDLLTTDEAAEHVRLSHRTLERYRVTDEGRDSSSSDAGYRIVARISTTGSNEACGARRRGA